MLDPAIQSLAFAAIQQSLMEVLAMIAMPALKQIPVKLEIAQEPMTLFVWL
jgi:hypothetical protein